MDSEKLARYHVGLFVSALSRERNALLGELLREVLSMAKAMEGLRGEVADLRAEIRDRAQQIPLSQRTLPDDVVGFPQTALRQTRRREWIMELEPGGSAATPLPSPFRAR